MFRRRALVAAVLTTAALALPTAAVAAVDPVGRYTGTHVSFDAGTCGDCRVDDAIVDVEAGPGGRYVVYYWQGGVVTSKAACGTVAGRFDCIRFTADLNASSGRLTGTGVKSPDFARGTGLELDVTVSGDRLTGRADWETCNDFSGGCNYYDVTADRPASVTPPPPPPPVKDPPAIAITSAPAKVTEETKATFTFAPADSDPPAGTVECSVDGAAFVSCASPLQLTDLAAGDHRLDVHYTREDGTQGPAETHKWAVDAPPIIFLPGFLGSRIVCPSGEAWPRIPDGLPRPLDMLLAADGVGDRDCRVPGGLPGLVQSVRLPGAESDVYAGTVRFLQDAAPGRFHVFAWDWRRSPQQALAALDDLIDRVRIPDGKVVLMAHSMGGLVTRAFLGDPDRARKVARAITVGTPFHGSPKSFFALATGTETIAPSSFDALFDNDELHEFARNLQGLYFLWPSPAFGAWLTVDGRGSGPLDPAGVRAFAAAIGGNAELLRRAHDTHSATLDAYPTGDVRLEVLAGTAVNTPRRVRITPLPAGLAHYEVEWGSGDGTVPAASAKFGGRPPAGRVHTVCGVEHVPLPGAPAVTSRLKDFLLRGDPVAGQDCDRPSSGHEIYIPVARLGDGSVTPPSRTASVRVTAQGSGAPMTVDDAERLGLVQVIDVPGARIVATDTATPVTLTVPRGSVVRVTPLDGDGRGAARHYPAAAGPLTLAAGTGVAVTRNRKPVKPLVKPDRVPPRTRAIVRGRGARRTVTFRASDPSGIRATLVKVGKGAERPVTKPLKLTVRQLGTVRFRSIDRADNVERPRRISVRPARR